MMIVIIDDVEYIPKAEVKPINDSMIQEVLEVLTSMRYFNQNHKMQSLAYDAIRSISPELADLEPEIAFSRIHGEEQG